MRCAVKRIVGDKVEVLEEGVDSAITTTTQPGPGDSTTVNNFVEFNKTNSFLCCTNIVMSSEDSTGKKNQITCLPQHTQCDVVVGLENIAYTLTIKIPNPFPNKTAAAIMQIPRIAGLVLVEENHRCGTVVYEPKVMEKEMADETFKQASASSSHTATLSNTTDHVFEIKIDKIGANQTALLSTTFLQPFVHSHAKVQPTADFDSQFITDVVIFPGFTQLEFAPVAFSLSIRALAPLCLDTIARDVLEEDAVALARYCSVQNLLAFSPSVDPSGQTVLRFNSQAGFACGTALKARFVHTVKCALADELAAMCVSDTAQGNAQQTGDETSLAGIVKAIDCLESIAFAPEDGSALSAVRVDLEIPKSLPGTKPAENPHEVFLIIDTSGSTGMYVEKSETFLAKCKSFVCGVIDVLPDHVSLLRSKGLMNKHPIQVHVWHFNSYTHELGSVILEDDKEQMKTAVSKAKSMINKLDSTGGTDFDEWSAKLEKAVSKRPTSMHHVLLLTDGGATNAERFEQRIRNTQAIPGVSFFQVDALGYGRWLNAQTVSFVTSQTNGEAILVETPSGDGMRTKILGLLARSFLRGASRMRLTINAEVLAVRNDAMRSSPMSTWCTQDMLQPGKPFVLVVSPGDKVSMEVLHKTSQPLSILLQQTKIDLTAQKGDSSDWDMCVDAEQSQRSKIHQPLTRQCLSHLLLLEPAYATNTQYPEATKKDRLRATLSVSIKGQIAAPSVTKACAVAVLAEEITPVPEHCMPEVEEQWGLSVGETMQSSSSDDDCMDEILFESENYSRSISPNCRGGGGGRGGGGRGGGGRGGGRGGQGALLNSLRGDRDRDRDRERVNSSKLLQKSKCESNNRSRSPERKRKRRIQARAVSSDDDDCADTEFESGVWTITSWLKATNGGVFPGAVSNGHSHKRHSHRRRGDDMDYDRSKRNRKHSGSVVPRRWARVLQRFAEELKSNGKEATKTPSAAGTFDSALEALDAISAASTGLMEMLQASTSNENRFKRVVLLGLFVAQGAEHERLCSVVGGGGAIAAAEQVVATTQVSKLANEVLTIFTASR